MNDKELDALLGPVGQKPMNTKPKYVIPPPPSWVDWLFYTDKFDVDFKLRQMAIGINRLIVAHKRMVSVPSVETDH